MGVKKLDKPTVTIEPELCKGCGLCLDACPPDVIKFHQKFNTKGYHYAYYIGEGCTGCGVCKMVCPVEAIEGEKKELHVIDQELCTKCGQCYDACKFDAITR